jgi:hypothetical protein
MSREINREEWNEIRPRGETVDTRVTVLSTGVDIEDYDGLIQAGFSAHEDGVDIGIGDLQLVAKKNRIYLMRMHPPYPIERWTVLWEGDLA